MATLSSLSSLLRRAWSSTEDAGGCCCSFSCLCGLSFSVLSLSSWGSSGFINGRIVGPPRVFWRRPARKPGSHAGGRKQTTMKDAKRRERPMSAIAPRKPARYPRGTVSDGVLLDEWSFRRGSGRMSLLVLSCCCAGSKSRLVLERFEVLQRPRHVIMTDKKACDWWHQVPGVQGPGGWSGS